ncbi:Unknown protein, partial [Striga hermonthica]
DIKYTNNTSNVIIWFLISVLRFGTVRDGSVRFSVRIFVKISKTVPIIFSVQFDSEKFKRSTVIFRFGVISVRFSERFEILRVPCSALHCNISSNLRMEHM